MRRQRFKRASDKERAAIDRRQAVQRLAKQQSADEVARRRTHAHAHAQTHTPTQRAGAHPPQLSPEVELELLHTYEQQLQAQRTHLGASLARPGGPGGPGRDADQAAETYARVEHPHPHPLPLTHP